VIVSLRASNACPAAARYRSRPLPWRTAALCASVLLLCSGYPISAQADQYAGLTLEQALQRLTALGLNIVYSSAQIQPEMGVSREPDATDPRVILDEIIAPYGLAVVEVAGGALMLVRSDAPSAAQSAPVAVQALPTALDEVVVSASYYRLAIEAGPPAALLTAGDIDMLPEIGGDPIRAVARLPGVARQDFSSKPHMRGGVADETLVRFDDLRLYNPYHLKDFQNLFSTVDPSVISRLNVYSAGFPVTYGDRLSGVIDIAPFRPERLLQGRLDVGFFNVGGMLAGQPQDRGTDWIVSARRGTLDLVLEATAPDLGRPRYLDLYGHLGHRLSDTLAISGNVLVSEDDLTIFDSDQEEEASADYRDEYYWLRFDLGDPERAGGKLLAAHTRLTSERIGSADLPGVARGSLTDRRNFRIDSIQAEGWWPLAGGSRLQAGAEWRGLRGRYDYQDTAEFDLLFLIPGAPTEPTRERQLAVSPAGDQYGAYVNWRVAPIEAVTADLGLRWDKETLSGEDSSQFSPRLGLLWQLDQRTRLRASWGRFFQAQGVDELQVSDGESQFFAAQRADHVVAGIERSLGQGFDLRLEAYRKTYDRLRPRYENLFDTLVVLPELKPDRARILPRGAKAEGAELSLGFEDGSGLGGWLSYSWSTVTDFLQGDHVRRNWDQAHYLSAGISRRGKAWEWSLAGAWHSGWPTTDIELATTEPIPLVAAGPRNARKLGSYARLDARVARRYVFGDTSELTVYLEISNLTNRHNDCCVEYQIEPQDGVTLLDVSTRATLPLIPSLGFSWQF
jgi:hypothetical protein